MLGSQIIEANPVFHGHDLGINAIKAFGPVLFRQAVLTEDSWQEHEGIEVVFMLQGEACWELSTQRLAQATGGQAIIFPVGCAHRIVNGIYPPHESLWILFGTPSEETSAGMLSDREFREFCKVTRAMSGPIDFSPSFLHRLQELAAVLRDRRLLIGSTLSIATVKARIYSVLVDFWELCSVGRSAASKSDVVERSTQFIKDRIDEEIRIEQIAGIAGCSRARLFTLFRKETGMSPLDFYHRLKIKKCCDLLVTTDEGVTEIAMAAGFSSSQYFARMFRRYLGTTPTAYRKIMAGRHPVA